MEFPQFVSFTVTNACNLRCRMCGQWSEDGYVLNRRIDTSERMTLQDWKRLVDEIASHKIRFVLVRGGEPFLFKGIIELLQYISAKGIFLSVDTNGAFIDRYAEDLSRIGNMHITFSVDGPEEVHDHVRNEKGSFQNIRRNIALLLDLEKKCGNSISKSICFTISKYNYRVLGKMADVARTLSIPSVNIVPYYYFSNEVGTRYDSELKENFGCDTFSWRGFHHEESGVEFDRFKEELRAYRASLGDIYDFPYMPLSEDEYRTWFQDQSTPVRSSSCSNVEELIDIQPNGEANFCVDFPDYSIGNVRQSSIDTVWNSPRANQFREYRRTRPLSVCHRCGAKYISEIKE
ncbi:MAG TPA: radical SAM protein [Bacteroidota bacterium]|nr:radical SAM protein [Bacteroidota bacterium]